MWVQTVVGVAESLNQRLDSAGSRCIAREIHPQVGTVTAAGKGSEGNAAVAHRVARNADLTRSVAFVHDAQLVFGRLTGQVIQVETSAVEVGRIGIAQADRRVDHLQAGIDAVFGEGDGADEVRQVRVGLARQLGRAAEELLVDAHARTVLLIASPNGDIVAVAKVGQRRFRLPGPIGSGSRAVDLTIAVNRVAGRVVLAHVDVGVRSSHAPTIVVEADDEAAGRQADDSRLVLASTAKLVDPKLRAVRRAVGVVTLGEDGGARAVLPSVIAPDDDEPAIRQHGNPRLVLIAHRRRVDAEFSAQRRTAGVEALPVDAGPAAVLPVRAPDDDVAAIGRGGDVGLYLIPGVGRIDQRLWAHLGTVVVEALAENVVALLNPLIVRNPGRDESLIEGGDLRPTLLVQGVSIELELAAQRDSAGLVALPENAPR